MKISEILLEDSIRDSLTKKYKLTSFTGSCGFSETNQKWYGWSHRAVCGFGIGDKIFEPDFGDENTKFSDHGKVTIKTMDQAKKAAQAFSDYVS